MALRPILRIPDPRLRKAATPVTDITDETKKLIKDMFETNAAWLNIPAPIGWLLGYTQYALSKLTRRAPLFDHRTFAEAYVSWLDAAKPSAAAVPIEDVGKQVIAPFLKGGASRRLSPREACGAAFI